MLLIKVTFTTQIECAVAVSGGIEDKLNIGARRNKCDFCVPLTTAVLKAYLPLLLGPVSVAGVSHLKKFKKN